jgi:hypothetical protein
LGTHHDGDYAYSLTCVGDPSRVAGALASSGRHRVELRARPNVLREMKALLPQRAVKLGQDHLHPEIGHPESSRFASASPKASTDSPRRSAANAAVKIDHLRL